MLKKTDHNRIMLARIHEAIDAFDGGEQHRTAVERANQDADGLSGIKTIGWNSIDREFAISWELKQGGILYVTTHKVEAGPVRITHEQRFFS